MVEHIIGDRRPRGLKLAGLEGYEKNTRRKKTRRRRERGACPRGLGARGKPHPTGNGTQRPPWRHGHLRAVVAPLAPPVFTSDSFLEHLAVFRHLGVSGVPNGQRATAL